MGREAQAFDLAGISNTGASPSFAHFAKGRSWVPSLTGLGSV
jgi:hypothetical protein